MARPKIGCKYISRVLWSIVHFAFFTKIGLTLCVVGLACSGADLLVWIEWPSIRQRFETRVQNAIKLQKLIDAQVEKMAATVQLNMYYAQTRQGIPWNSTQIETYLNSKTNVIIDAVLECEDSGVCSRNIPVWNPALTYPKALTCILSLMTGVDYGMVQVASAWGKCLVIIYALFGLPMFYSFLALVGNSIRIFLRHIGRKYVHMKPKKEYDPVTKTVVITYEASLHKNLVFPLPVSMLLISCYIFIGASVFSILEQWNIVHSFYFAAITISGVGVGDSIPGSSATEYKSLTKGAHLAVLIVYSVLGLALLMVCWQMTEFNFLERWKKKAQDARGFFLPIILEATSEEVKAELLKEPENAQTTSTIDSKPSTEAVPAPVPAIITVFPDRAT